MSNELQNLAKVFNQRLFRIPDYQRGYAWGNRQLSDFWSDLKRLGSDRTHYCGQLTLERADEASWKQWSGDEWLVEAGYEPNFVVDGQQRLTTSVIVLQCLLEDRPADGLLAQLKVSELREKYLAKGNGILQSCLFGYAKDNPSHEYFRTKILGVPSNEFRGERTVYTSNLGFARDFFREKLDDLTSSEQEAVFKTLTQRFRFNIHELNDDIDVFVAFETMNNRGKMLSRLELLKNRLIYLSTLSKRPDQERRKVRSNINAVWRTVYEELGRHPEESLDDDEFLRAHWIVFFGYDSKEPDPLTQFLLNRHFTSQRMDEGKLSLGDIQDYVDSLQVSARTWQRLHFPENHQTTLGPKVTSALTRLKRLGFGVLRPLLLAALSKNQDEEKLLGVLEQGERFLLLVRSFAGSRSHVAESESYRLANEIHETMATLVTAKIMLRERVERHFKIADFQRQVDDLSTAQDGRGFYGLPGLSFVLFEYEESLRKAAKAASAKIAWDDFRGSKNSIEHVYPQTPEADQWPLFERFTEEQQRLLTNSLGNLVAVSVAKNASLSRRCFEDKKGTEASAGFGKGSFSELEIAQAEDWTPESILRRGLELLDFIEERWKVDLGDRETKVQILKLEFLEEEMPA